MNVSIEPLLKRTIAFRILVAFACLAALCCRAEVPEKAPDKVTGQREAVGQTNGLTGSQGQTNESNPAHSGTSTPPSNAPPVVSREVRPIELGSNWLQALSWRSIGPAGMGGRIVDFAVVESDPSTYWVATASGGLLKTTNNGVTFIHQFEHETAVSIGSVCVAASDPNIVWVGTGENNPRNSVSYGDGVYKSTDGGKSWKNMGLKKPFQIGRIVIDRTNPNVVYVGALGRLYGPSEERGLYK